MKTKTIFIVLLFIVSFSLFAQNDIEKINAAFISPHNNKAYFFVGKNKVYQYNTATKKREWIRTLGTNTFKGLKGSSNIDAVFAIPNTQKAYLFRGNKWYLYNLKEAKLEKQGIVGYDAFKGLTGPFNGAVVRGSNYVFFKDNKVYFYNPKKSKVIFSGTVNKSNLYTGVPTNIDGVVEWTNGMLYFFKNDDLYYRYNPSKKKVDYIRVIGRDGFKNLFPSIDAAINAVAFQKNYYWEKPSKYPRINIYGLSQLNKEDIKTTKFGIKHFEGVPPNVNTAFRKYRDLGIVYFFKGTKYYRYNGTTRKVDKTGDIKTAWDGLSAPIDAAFYNKEYCYFFKKDRFWKYNTKTKRLDSGNWIKTVFRGVPNYLDAAILYEREIYFYKKRTEYVYDINKRKVVARNSIAKIAK